MTERVKQLVVLSGKGGTGKTSVAASLASLLVARGRRLVLADADVDASNLHLLVAVEEGEEHDFIGAQAAKVTASRCLAHGECVEHCRFDAIELVASQGGHARARVETTLCEGCGVCAVVCPERAIEMHDQVAGVWRRGESALGPLVDARLAAGGESSGKLVTRVRQAALEEAARVAADLVLVDGPPGIGCPVIAAVTGADLMLAVTEPTPPARSDLERLLALAQHFGIPVAVVVNKADLNPGLSSRLAGRLEAAGVEVVGTLAYDEAIPRALRERRLPVEASAGAAEALRRVADRVERLLEQGPSRGRDLVQIKALGLS